MKAAENRKYCIVMFGIEFLQRKINEEYFPFLIFHFLREYYNSSVNKTVNSNNTK